MKQLVVISGKGGTGKTSITASFAVLSDNAVIADCDVDAADMHLILRPDIKKAWDFIGGKEASIDQDMCTACGECYNLCRFNAVLNNRGEYVINQLKCEGCSVCSYFCPVDAIKMEEKVSGKAYISETRSGMMVHAALGIGEENSGKLVYEVRENSRKVAQESGAGLIVIDGPPGIGCPVIASITGTDLALVVTEPTVSGFHDLKRVVQLLSHFKIKCAVCINKFDLNLDMTEDIQGFCDNMDIRVLSRVPYDNSFTGAQLEAKSIVEFTDGETATEIKKMWEGLCDMLFRDDSI